MARIRSVKPEVWVDERFAECSTGARLLLIAMSNFADDRGVHPAKPRTLKAEAFPMDDLTAGQVTDMVDELIRAGLVRGFTALENGESYWHIVDWERDQRIDRPSYKYPAPPPAESPNTRRTDSPNTRRDMLDDDSSSPRRAPPPGEDRSGDERRGEESGSPKARTSAPKKAKSQIPTDFVISPRVQAWADAKGFSGLEQHLEAFKAKCAAKGYSYLDWDAAFMEAVREDWAKLRSGAVTQRRQAPVLHADDDLREAAR